MGHRIDDAAGWPITLIQGVDTLLGTAPPPRPWVISETPPQTNPARDALPVTADPERICVQTSSFNGAITPRMLLVPIE